MAPHRPNDEYDPSAPRRGVETHPEPDGTLKETTVWPMRITSAHIVILTTTEEGQDVEVEMDLEFAQPDASQIIETSFLTDFLEQKRPSKYELKLHGSVVPNDQGVAYTVKTR